MIPPTNENSQELDRLFQRFRQATEYVDAGPNFMPQIWQRIEARRKNTLMVERFARVFASATMALAVFAGVFVSFATPAPERDSWVETLANQHLAQNVSYYEPVRLSTGVDPR